jgi:hypothetical protein
MALALDFWDSRGDLGFNPGDNLLAEKKLKK